MNTNPYTSVTELMRAIVSHGNMDPAKADKMVADLTKAWITNISSGMLENIAEEKRVKYSAVLDRIADLKQDKQPEIGHTAIEQIMSQFTPEQFEYIFVQETLPMLTQLLESVSPTLSDEARQDLEKRIDALFT